MKYLRIFEQAFNEALQLRKLLLAFLWVISVGIIAALLGFEFTWKLLVLLCAADFLDMMIYGR